MQPKITIITGHQGSGKSTLIRQLFPNIMESGAKNQLAITNTLINPRKETILFQELNIYDLLSIINTYQVYDDINTNSVIETQLTRLEIEDCYKYNCIKKYCLIKWIELSNRSITPPPPIKEDKKIDDPFDFANELNNLAHKLAHEAAARKVKYTTTTSAILAEAHAIQQKINSFIKELESCEIKR